MSTLGTNPELGKMSGMKSPEDFHAVLAHHDAAIHTLGTQMKTLQGEVHLGFSSMTSTLSGLSSKLDRLDARPSIDIHKTVGTIQSLAILFSMVVAGIIYVTSSHTAAQFAKQEMSNAAIEKQLGQHDEALNEIAPRLTWNPKTTKEGK